MSPTEALRHVPILLIDVADFTLEHRGVPRQRALLQYLQALLTESARFFMPYGDVWTKWKRHGTGDGYYFLFDALPPQVALQYARTMSEAVTRFNADNADLQIHLRQVLVLGDAEWVGDQILSEAFAVAERLISDGRFKEYSRQRKELVTLATGALFHLELATDLKKECLFEGLDELRWSPFEAVDKHGQRHPGYVLGEGWTSEPAGQDSPAKATDPTGKKGHKAPELQPRLQDYLRWVLARTGHLALSGVDPGAATSQEGEKRVRLGAVYTALRTLSPRHGEKGEGGELEPVLGRRAPGEEGPPLSALEELETHRRLVLLGDPGSGKSTFVHFVALCLAGEALGDSEANLEELTAPLPKDEEGEGEKEERQPWSHGALVPVLVTLRELAARGLAAGTAKDLWDFLVGELDEAALGGFAPALERALSDGRCLVLLDGLDEVPEAARRRHLLCQAVTRFAERFPQSRMVLTSRIYAYQKQDFRLPGFAEATLAPFGEAQIRRFVEGWYAHVAELKDLRGEDAQGRAAVLCRAIFQSSRLSELAERPLLLTLMASLHAWRGGSLPERREELYSEAVDLLLDLWERRRLVRNAQGELDHVEPSLAQYLRTDKEALRRVLEELAYEAHAAQPREEPGTADLEQADLVGRLLRLRRDPEDNPVKLVDYLSERSGLLEAHGVEVFRFPHRTFQEYLAACHLHRGPFDNDEIAELVRRDPNRWREVLLLAAARSGSKDVWSLVESLLGEAETASERAWGAALAGQAAAETANLEQLSPGRRRRLEALQGRLVSVVEGEALSASERVLAGASLARLGDPRFDPDLWYLPREPALGFAEVPGGTYTMGADDLELLAGLPTKWAERSKPVHEVTLSPFYLGRYPVTVAEFRAFVESTSFEVENRGALEGASNAPVVLVSWAEAREYCAWLTVRLRELAQESRGEESEAGRFWWGLSRGALRVDLPSEAQWEAGARGSEARRYPWGESAPAPDLANYGRNVGHASPVGAYAKGTGPFGTQDQSGNVWEWCRDAWDPKAYAKRVAKGKGVPVLEEGEDEVRVLRGGAWDNPAPFLGAADRNWYRARHRLDVIGFRLCCAASEP